MVSVILLKLETLKPLLEQRAIRGRPLVVNSDAMIIRPTISPIIFHHYYLFPQYSQLLTNALCGQNMPNYKITLK